MVRIALDRDNFLHHSAAVGPFDPTLFKKKVSAGMPGLLEVSVDVVDITRVWL